MVDMLTGGLCLVKGGMCLAVQYKEKGSDNECETFPVTESSPGSGLVTNTSMMLMATEALWRQT